MLNDALLVAVNAKYIHTALGIRSIKAFIGDSFRVQTLELTINDPFDAMLRQVYENRAKIVGFSCYIWNIDLILKIAQNLHAMDDSITIILGGPEVTYDAAEMMKKHSFIDAIAIGEGEESFSALLRASSQSPNQTIDFSALPGFCYRNGDSIQSNEPSALIGASQIPLAYDMDALPQAPQIIYYESSRGCPFRCAFCLSRATPLRERDAHETIAHLIAFAKKNVHQVKLVDRTFNANLSRAKEIWHALINIETSTNFHFEIAAHTLDDEAIALLQTAPKGRFQFEIGVQSTNAATLKAIDRPDCFEKISKVVHALQKNNNIHLHLDLIAGLPYENLSAFERSFNEVFALKSEMLQLGFLKLLKGSRLREIADSFGCRYSETAPYEVRKTASLSADDLFALHDCERALDLFAHSRHCKNAVKYLLSLQDNAFAFFMALGHYIKNKSLQKPAARAETLWNFSLGYSLVSTQETFDALSDLLAFDYLKPERRTELPFRAPFLSEVQISQIKKFYKEHSQEYFPDYPGNAWRISQVYFFNIDVLHFEQTSEVIHRKSAVLFNCRNLTQRPLDMALFLD